MELQSMILLRTSLFDLHLVTHQARHVLLSILQLLLLALSFPSRFLVYKIELVQPETEVQKGTA